MRSKRSNGAVVSFVGRNRIKDSSIALILFFVFFPLAPLFLLYKGRKVRDSWKETLFQLFSIGSYPYEKHEQLYLTQENKLRIVCMSDTHMLHRQYFVPDGEVFIHCGDFTNHGSLDEVKDFADWLASLPHLVKIIVPGNHDMILDEEYYEEYWSDWSVKHENAKEAMQLLRNIPNTYVLIDQGINVNGITFWGSPWVPKYASWRTAFNKTKEEMTSHWQSTLPAEVDVLITHTPAFGIKDREPFGTNCGCVSLTEAVLQIKPKFHLFGHIHADFGVHHTHHTYSETASESVKNNNSNSTMSINASSVCDYYISGNRDPFTFDIAVPGKPNSVIRKLKITSVTK